MRYVASVLRSVALWTAFAVVLVAWPTEIQAQYFRFGKNKVQYGKQDWMYLQSKHFDLYFDEGAYYLADFAAKAAEEAYDQISNLFQHRISDRIPIIIYQSHNDFAVTNAAPLPANAEGIGGVTELYKNRIAIPFVGDYRDFRRVIHHELVHAVINDMFYGGSFQSIIQNNIQLRIPLWFNEGLAEYAALGWDSQSDMYVREAILEDDLAPIPHLWGFLAYRGGQGVWDYVAEQYGREKISEIVQRLRMTRSVEASFKRGTGLALEELSERWHKTLREIHYPEVGAREDLDDIARPILTRKNAGFYNSSPALSPKGDKVAFITTRDGFFDVYIASANDGEILHKLIEGQTSAEFESLRILTPGISWSPDGEQIAVAVKSGRSDAIAVVHIRTGRTTHYRVPGIDQIVSVAWSPQGDQIAFEGSMNAQGDIYVLDLTTRQTTNYTSDLFSDHEPAWSPDGKALVFHSDRGSYTRLGRYREENFQMIDHEYGRFDLYRLQLGETQVERLTHNEIWDEKSARFGEDPHRLLFLSDRNGIFNLYEKNLETGVERPLTDVLVGIMQMALSADGQKAALVSLKDGTPSIYALKTPFERRMDRDELAPNVWAQRVMQETRQPAPALALASAARRQSNPFLRDATDGVAYARVPAPRREELLASRLRSFMDDFGRPASLSTTNGSNGTNGEHDDGTEQDTTVIGRIKVDFRDYVFGEGFEDAVEDVDDGLETYYKRFSPRDNIDEEGNYKPKRYKLKFSPDLVYGTAGYDALYGVQGVTQMMFSDMLGNHQIFVATNLLIDLRNSDYLISYRYLPGRIDWSVSAYHVSRLLLDANLRIYRYRWFGSGIAASYPLDKFRRVDVDVSVLGVSQVDVSDPVQPAFSRTLLYPRITYTRDVTTPGFLFPRGGHRFALSVSGSPGTLQGEQTQFVSVLADARLYTSFGRGRYSFAIRGSGGASFGPDQQLFYSSGVQNWINRSFDDQNGFPIDDVSDFLFATPVLPLRGYEINARNGSYFGLLNTEFRFPLVAALLPGPIPILPLYNIQGTAFVDAGALWGGRSVDKRFNVFHRNEAGERVFDDVLVGAGVGLRTILLGYPVRLDYAWPYDGKRFGKRQVYFSIGLDF
ncbi:MAG: peptidase MA family metallohydrolase [Rhodothermales bacterium]